MTPDDVHIVGESEKYLIELLRSEVDAAQLEVESLRGSLRYRLGDLVLQAWPPSLRSLIVLPRLFSVFRTFRRNQRFASSAKGRPQLSVAPSFPSSPVLVYGTASAEISDDTWCTKDVEALVQRLDTEPAERLVLRELRESVVRRLARLQLQGCHIVWWPDQAVPHAPELEAYVKTLADECWVGDVR